MPGGRPRLGSAARTQGVTVKFTAAEVQHLDAVRGNQARGAYLRSLFQTVESPNPPLVRARPARSPKPLNEGERAPTFSAATDTTTQSMCAHPNRWRSGDTCTWCGTIVAS